MNKNNMLRAGTTLTGLAAILIGGCQSTNNQTNFAPRPTITESDLFATRMVVDARAAQSTPELNTPITGTDISNDLDAGSLNKRALARQYAQLSSKLFEVDPNMDVTMYALDGTRTAIEKARLGTFSLEGGMSTLELDAFLQNEFNEQFTVLSHKVLPTIKYGDIHVGYAIATRDLDDLPHLQTRYNQNLKWSVLTTRDSNALFIVPDPKNTSVEQTARNNAQIYDVLFSGVGTTLATFNPVAGLITGGFTALSYDRAHKDQRTLQDADVKHISNDPNVSLLGPSVTNNAYSNLESVARFVNAAANRPGDLTLASYELDGRIGLVMVYRTLQPGAEATEQMSESGYESTTLGSKHPKALVLIGIPSKLPFGGSSSSSSGGVQNTGNLGQGGVQGIQ